MTPALTPSQTIGPFFALTGGGLPWPDGPHVVAAGTPGGLWIRGVIRDGAGEAVTDALVETWQADPDGHLFDPADRRGVVPGFRGFGRCATDADGRFALLTVKPGRVAAIDGGLQAPHIAVSVFARGLLDRVYTRMYFADETAANAEDAVLAALGHDRRGTLLAVPADDGYRFDIRLQGEHETVFFSV